MYPTVYGYTFASGGQTSDTGEYTLFLLLNKSKPVGGISLAHT